MWTFLQAHFNTCTQTGREELKIWKHVWTVRTVAAHHVPQRHLSLTHATEAGAEDLLIRHEHGPDGPGALVRLLLLLSSGWRWRRYRTLTTNITVGAIFQRGGPFFLTRWPRGGNPRRERCPCAGPTLAGSYLCRRWGSWCRLCSSRRCRWGRCVCCRSSPRPPHGPRSTGSPRYRSLRGEIRSSFTDSTCQLITVGLDETSAECYTFTGRTSSISAPAPLRSYRSHEGVIPALISTLWAVGCQLRMPTRLEWPSSLTTGSVSGEVSPLSGISQIYLPTIKPHVKQGPSETWRTAGGGGGWGQM